MCQHGQNNHRRAEERVDDPHLRNVIFNSLFFKVSNDKNFLTMKMIDDNDHNDKIITIIIVITLITLKTMILMLAGWLLHPSTPDKDFPPPELFQHCLASGEKGANSSDCVSVSFCACLCVKLN